MKEMLLAAVLQVVPWVFPEVIVLHRDLRSPDEAVLLPYAISASQPMGVLEVMRYGWVTTFTPIRGASSVSWYPAVGVRGRIGLRGARRESGR